jgi:hypothetical protein
MSPEEFIQTILHPRMKKIAEVLAQKSTEYSNKNDRFYNFRKQALIMDVTPVKALLGNMSKHLVSVLDILNAGSASPEVIDEKFGDLINYLILAEGLLKE